MSSSDEKSQKKRKERRTRVSNFCSTPVLIEKARRLSSISISAVETNSSSSAPRTSRTSRGQTVEKAPTKKRKRKQGSKARRQNRRNAERDSNSEWETKSELSVHEEPIPQRLSTQNAASTSESVLFKDVYGSPQRVRKDPYFFENDCVESPVFRPTRRIFGSPEKMGFKENEGILVVEDLPTCQARVDDVDEEADNEEELNLRKSSTAVTYPGSRKEKWHKRSKKTVECHAPVGKVRHCVAGANLLWDNFVKDYYEKHGKYIGLSQLSERQESQSNEGGECLSSHKNQNSKKTLSERWRLKPDLSKMNIIHGWLNKYSEKSVRADVYKAEDVYKFPPCEDPEFKRVRRGRKMTLNEYLCKCRMEKENLGHCSLDSRSSVVSQNPGESWRSRNDSGTMQKGASPCENFEHEFERSKVESMTQSKRPTSTRPSLKRANNADIDGNAAKRPMIVKNKPTIRLIEPVPSRYKEYVQNLLELCAKHYAD